MRLCLLALLTLLCGCAVPPSPADPKIPSGAVRTPHFEAPEFRLHIVSVNNAQIPEEALQRSADTISAHLGKPVRIIRHDPIVYPPEAQADDPSSFPIFENGRAVSDAEMRAAGSQPYLLQTPHDGLLGAVGLPQPGDSIFPRPYVENAVALVVVAPGGARGVTGFTTVAAIRAGCNRAARGRGPPRCGDPQAFQSVRVALQALRVDADARTRPRPPRSREQHPHLGRPTPGPHCTHPECVMYTGLDWRVVVSGLLHGWPLDFCPECTAELTAAREAANRPHAQ